MILAASRRPWSKVVCLPPLTVEFVITVFSSLVSGFLLESVIAVSLVLERVPVYVSPTLRLSRLNVPPHSPSATALRAAATCVQLGLFPPTCSPTNNSLVFSEPVQGLTASKFPATPEGLARMPASRLVWRHRAVATGSGRIRRHRDWMHLSDSSLVVLRGCSRPPTRSTSRLPTGRRGGNRRCCPGWRRWRRRSPSRRSSEQLLFEELAGIRRCRCSSCWRRRKVGFEMGFQTEAPIRTPSDSSAVVLLASDPARPVMATQLPDGIAPLPSVSAF